MDVMAFAVYLLIWSVFIDNERAMRSNSKMQEVAMKKEEQILQSSVGALEQSAALAINIGHSKGMTKSSLHPHRSLSHRWSA